MNKVRMIIDILMTVLLPVLMAYSLVGEQAHEILGMLMFGLFVVHHVINRKWWTGLFRGKYNAVRILSTVVNIFLAVFMIMQPVSGILMSKYILKNVTIGGTASVMRTIHMTLAYWGFIMMSFHIGLHARMMVGKVAPKMKTAVRKGVTFLFIIGAVYGVYAFVHRGIVIIPQNQSIQWWRKQKKSCNNLRSLIDACKVYSSMKRYKEHLAKAKNPKLYAAEHADQLSAYDTSLTTLELNKVPTDLVSSDYIGELQKFLQSYEAEAAKIGQQIAENDQMMKEFVKVQRELNAYHNISDEI